MKNAIISVSDKTHVLEISNFLLKNNYNIYSTGGTYNHIVNSVENIYKDNIINIPDLTQFPEILGGRVKTLHPRIYGGILADIDNTDHIKDINTHNLPLFSVVIVNLYFFEKNNCVENIDIGGVSLIRAASKNYKHITILTNPNQYNTFIENYTKFDINYRKNLAFEGFKHTSNYDSLICNFLNPNNSSYSLKYGFNPHQTPCNLEIMNGQPFNIINGVLGYINVLDFLHGWLTVYEIDTIVNLPTFISMKHTSPAGLGVGNTITQETLDIFGVNRNINELTQCEIAFIKSRNGDPLSSFGDFICCSSIVDVETARLIKREVCDGIAATGYTKEALEILKQKKNGKFIIVEMNSNYYKEMCEKGWLESKELYGVKITQPYNNFIMDNSYTIDEIIAYTVLKYSQSNNISMVYNGQLIGIGCGQQNRVACVELAGNKANKWKCRHHPKTISYYKSLDSSLKRQEKVNKVYDFISENKLDDNGEQNINITMGSDGFFPFVDNIILANIYGVKNILQPGGSIMDAEVEKTCKNFNISIKNINTRMFYH